MFLEKNFTGNISKGWIEVIAGSMFSGKTEELIRRLKRAKIAKQNVKIFKPAIDTRYSENKVVSHDANSIDSIVVNNSEEILNYTKNIEVVGIDEVQFFDKKITKICKKLANNGIRVIVAGLDMDFQGKPFGAIPQIMATAEYVTKVHAICMKCGNIAQFSHRLSESENLVELGEKNEYEPLCRHCYNKEMRKKKKYKNIESK